MPNLFPSCHLGGFGLGALNDADEDDLDVYDIQNQGSRHRVAYDFIGGDDDEPVLLGSKAAKQSKSTGVCPLFLLLDAG